MPPGNSPHSFSRRDKGLAAGNLATDRLALADVTRAFDVASVNCELLPDDRPGVLVTVSGDHKNGHHLQDVVPVPWSD